MEVSSPFEGLEDGDWISPRISFSQDFQVPGRCSPMMQFKDSPEEEFSFMFRMSANVDLAANDSMLSADELFFNGKVRSSQEDSNVHAGGGYLDDWNLGLERRMKENPHCFSMARESCRGDTRGRRAYMSLNNSRCSSPSRTMSMPHTTPTSPKSASHLPSSSALSTSAVTSSMTLSGWSTPSYSVISLEMPSSSSSSLMSSVLPSSTPTSSSKYSSKIKEFFMLKKGTTSKGAATPFVPFTSTSAEISRDSAQTSGSTSCRLPSRSFWPFSRSNSAGESKSTPAVSPTPRRSNSAGEGKTTSSSLLPVNSGGHRNAPPVASTNVQVKALPTAEATTSSTNTMSVKSLPPLPNSNARKTNAQFVPVCRGTNLVAPSSKSTPVETSSLFNGSIESTGSTIINEAEPSLTSPYVSPACASESSMLSDERNASGHAADASQVVRKGRSGTNTSPGRPIPRGMHGNATRNFTRGSPGRRGVWNSPGRSNGGRVSIRNLDRGSGSISSKGHVRPKDLLSRDGASVRISPVLNVAVPSLRGTKAASKSKSFSLGNLFSKKDRVTSLRAYTALPPGDGQNGV